MHNNDFDILLRSVHLSPKLQIPKIHKNIKKIKCYLYNTSCVFAFTYKLYLAQNFQFCFRTSHPSSPYPMSRYRTGYDNVITFVENM